jgi:transcriptional regulator with XRE-family HTH domain
MHDLGAKIRDVRRSQKMSLRELAMKADVSPSLISQIESGKANPSVATLYSITAALSLPIQTLFSDTVPKEEHSSKAEEHTEDVNSDTFSSREQALQKRVTTIPFEENHAQPRSVEPVVHPETRATIELMGGVTWSRLTPDRQDGIEFMEVHYDVGGSSGSVLQHHMGREFGLILEGVLQIELGFERYILHAGDSIIFDSLTPHRFTNIGQVPLRAIWVTFER